MVINEKEIRHEVRDNVSKLEILMSKLSKQNKIENLIVTKGGDGAVLYQKSKNKFYYTDAFANRIVDKVGAGDTMLSIIGPCIKSNLDKDITLLIGSLAASQSVESIGNKNSINKTLILRTLENLLK